MLGCSHGVKAEARAFTSLLGEAGPPAVPSGTGRWGGWVELSCGSVKLLAVCGEPRPVTRSYTGVTESDPQ